MIYFIATVIVMLIFGLVFALAVISGRKPVGSCSVMQTKTRNEEVYCETCSTMVKDTCPIPDKK